jgi:hypothetical protein
VAELGREIGLELEAGVEIRERGLVPEVGDDDRGERSGGERRDTGHLHVDEDRGRGPAGDARREKDRGEEGPRSHGSRPWPASSRALKDS